MFQTCSILIRFRIQMGREPVRIWLLRFAVREEVCSCSFYYQSFGGRIQMGREPVRIWLLGLTQRRSAYGCAQCYFSLSVFWLSLLHFRRSICLEFAACQSAKFPHCVWVQSIFQDFSLHTGFFTNLGRPFLCRQIVCWCWSFLYSAILHSRADWLRSHVILHEWLDFHSTFLIIHQSG